MKQSTCGAVFCQPGGDELKHDINTTMTFMCSVMENLYLSLLTKIERITSKI